MTDLLLDIADTADELTNTRRHVERIQDDNGHGHKRIRRAWTVVLPSLLEELGHAVIPGETYTDTEPGRSAFESRPAARLDAVDRLIAIEAGAAVWCNRTRLALRETAAGNIRAMVGAAGAIGSDNQQLLLWDLRAWRTWAATVTGWERPADAPRSSCPNCSRINTIRVRLDRETGCCLACGAWWDKTTIGILAQHIRESAEHPAADTTALRTAAVTARRDWEARRIALAPTRRPDLPYLA